VTVRLIVCGLAVLAAVWIIGWWIPAGLSSGEAELSWRQAEIIRVRAQVHGCQDRLGFRRSPVAQRVITGGERYRAWVLYRWRVREDFCLDVERQLSDPRTAVMAVFGRHGRDAVRVFECESHLNPYARNGQYLGIAQMGSWARSRYGHSSSALGQARAAYRNFRDNGWSQWSCASIVGVV
jgi:hypothetical protein